MEGGTSTGTLMLIGIIIFGIFVVIAYWLFQNQIQSLLADMMTKVSTLVDNSFETEPIAPGAGGLLP